MQSRTDSSHAVFHGVPGFFRACCSTASAGIGIGYDHPGRELARHIYDLDPYDSDPDDWIDDISSLEPLVRARDDKAVLSWFVLRFPACMALVPRRRRSMFVEGVKDSLREIFGIDNDISS